MENINAIATGTVYLKRSYQRNFLVAEIVLIAAMGMAIGICAMLMTDEKAVEAGPIVTIDPTELLPPPVVKRIVSEVMNAKPPKPPDLSLVEAGEDSTVNFEFTMASRDELAPYNEAFNGEFGEGTIFVDPVEGLEEMIPAQDSFIAFDEAPKAIAFPAAKYPEIARKAQIEGSVWLKVFVDAVGNVLDVVVAKASSTNAGFEEAAIAAARVSKWRPAMQNKQPIGVWISYEVRFKLK